MRAARRARRPRAGAARLPRLRGDAGARAGRRAVGGDARGLRGAAAGRAEPAAVGPTADGSPVPRSSGGRAERARLSALWRAAERGRAQLVLVTRRAGHRQDAAGRGAALLVRPARRADRGGALVRGRGRAGLRAGRRRGCARRRSRRAAAGSTARHLAELARLLPELVPRAARPAPPRAAARERAAAAAVRRARRRRSSPRARRSCSSPTTCTGRPETLQFLHYLLRAEPEAPLLVAATARREELDRSHPLNDLLAGLRSLERLAELELGRLSRQETAVLAERLAGRRSPRPSRGPPVRRDRGQPAVRRRGAARRLDGRARRDRGRQPEGAGGDRVPARAAVRAGPRSGRRRRDDRPRVHRRPARGGERRRRARPSSRGSTSCGGAGIVREQGADAYDFSHDKIREVAYHALSPARRRQHHLRVARALERLHAADLERGERRSSRSHYDRAGAADEAVDWYGRAADAALRLHAHDEAVRVLERALELSAQLPATAERDSASSPAHRAPGAARGRRGLPVRPPDRRPGARARPRRRSSASSRSRRCCARWRWRACPATTSRRRAPSASSCARAASATATTCCWSRATTCWAIAAFWQGRLDGRARALRGRGRALPPRAAGRPPPALRAGPGGRLPEPPGQHAVAARATPTTRRTRDEALALADAGGHPLQPAVAHVFADAGARPARRRRAARARDAARVRGGAAARRPLALTAEVWRATSTCSTATPHEGIERDPSRHDACGEPRARAPGQPSLIAPVLLEALRGRGRLRGGPRRRRPRPEARLGARLWEPEAAGCAAEFLAALGAPRPPRSTPSSSAPARRRMSAQDAQAARRRRPRAGSS